MTEGFRSRVATNVAPMAQRDPAAFSNGLAEGLQALGQAGFRAAQQEQATDERLAQLEYERRTQEEHLSLGRELQDARAAFEQRQLEAQAAPPDSLDGYADKLAEDWHTTAQAIAGKATSRDAQNSLVQQSAAIGAGLRLQGQRFEIATRVTRQRDDLKHAGDTFESQMLDHGQGKEVEAGLAYRQLAAYGDGLAKTIGADAARRWVRDTTAGMQRRQAEGAINRGEFDFARDLIGSDQAKATWDPDIREGLGDQLSTAERVAAARAQAQQAAAERARLALSRQQQEDARDAIRAVEAKVDAGIVPTDGELAGVQVQARRAGLKDHEQIKFHALSIQTDVNRRFADAGGDQLRQARAGYLAKGGDDGQIAARQFDKLIDAADSKEAATIKALVGQGPAGTIQALAALKGSPERRYDVAEKLEKGLGYVAGLDSFAQQATLEGKAILAARPKEFANDQQAVAAIDRRLGAAKPALGGLYGAVLDNARQIHAWMRNSKGQAGFDATDMDLAIRFATGASTRRDGTVQGGIGRVRGSAVILPDWATAREFDATVSRASFAAARFADGSPVQNPAQALATTRPEWAGDDDGGSPVYRFVDSRGKPLRIANGAEFHLTLSRR